MNKLNCLDLDTLIQFKLMFSLPYDFRLHIHKSFSGALNNCCTPVIGFGVFLYSNVCISKFIGQWLFLLLDCR